MENLAAFWLLVDDTTLRTRYISVFVVGFFLAGFIKPKLEFKIERSDFFLYSSALILSGSFLKLLWVFIFQAQLFGNLSILVLATLMYCICSGGAFRLVAIGRCNDAFGSRRLSAYALIPIANLVLLFWPSISQENDSSGSSQISTLASLRYILGVSFLMSILYVDPLIDRMANALHEKEKALPEYSEILVSYQIRSRGLVQTIIEVAEYTPTPQFIDKKTYIFSLEAEGIVLRYNYQISFIGLGFSPEFEQTMINTTCADFRLTPLLRAGAIIEHSYFGSDMREVGTIAVVANNCF